MTTGKEMGGETRAKNISMGTGALQPDRKDQPGTS